VRALARYHEEIVARLREVLGERLVGVYAAGSFALGAFDPTRSDVDVFAVCSGAVTTEEKHAIVHELRHESLPCPARGLEFVLYSESTVRVPNAEAGFLLNLNSGPRMDFHVDEEPGRIERHWFPLDRAIVRTAGVPLTGPPPAEVFAPMPRSILLPVVREGLEWYRVDGRSGDGSDAVLNACRSLRWFREDVWSSKTEAGAWALEQTTDTQLVRAALERRKGGPPLDGAQVAAFLDRVLRELSAAA
jgi:Domain of unknown function (DUF4111)/Nucleotidyltransferase domain